MPWINSSLKRAIRNKSKAWAAFANCPSISSLNLALSKQDIYANFEIKAKLKYEILITNDLKHNFKAFYAYLRNRRKVKSVVTTLKKDKQLGSLTQNDSRLQNVLQMLFLLFLCKSHLDLSQSVVTLIMLILNLKLEVKLY